MENSADNGAPPDYAKVLEAIATDIEALKGEYPQLANFAVADHLDPGELTVTYGFNTKQSDRMGGWVACVPNPKEDGIWFYICAHDPNSMEQIHTQPVVPPMFLGKKKVTYLILEGAETKRFNAALSAILKKHGVVDEVP